jgi:hypothetical protein
LFFNEKNLPGLDGELAKTYFFDKTHQREGVSGIIPAADYEARFTKILN